MSTTAAAMATVATTTAKPGLVKQVLSYRLAIDEEFQGWILMFSTLTVLWLFCLPCYCAGLSYPWARRFAQKVALAPKTFYIFMFIFNNLLMYLIVTWLPDWEYADYMQAVAKGVKMILNTVLKSIDSIVIILGAVFVFAFKDRIALLLGLDHKQLFRCKVRDFTTCLAGSRFKPLELQVLRVEDLSASSVFNANNVFIEVWLGYNEGMKTRVYNNAGSSCVMKQTLQLNYDEGDEEEQLLILVKNQKMVGASELGRLTLTSEGIQECVTESMKRYSGGDMEWTENYFIDKNLAPRGKIYFRLVPRDEEYHASDALLTC